MRNGPLKATAMSPSYAPLIGSQLSCTPNAMTSSSATQKKGSAPRNIEAGVMKESKREPTREPARTPIEVPMTNASTAVRPTSPIVQGSPERITSHTGVG